MPHLPIPSYWRSRLAALLRYLRTQLDNPWTKLSVLLVLALLATRRELSLSFSINGSKDRSVVTDDSVGPPTEERTWTARERKQLAYVARYRDIALAEQTTHGIPASITLAQALLESGIGESTLATRNNNHFGLKCFSKTCAKGHCSNHSDDHHKDFFRIFSNAEESYRAHGKLLRKQRYRKLFSLSRTDYRGWARGLSEAGYATDPRYADKLIGLIENLELHRWDR